MESGSYIIVQLNIHVLLLGDFFIPDLYLLLDPVGEDGTKDGSDDIAYPITADLVDFSFVWHITLDIIRLFPAKLRDFLECETFIMRHADVSHVLRKYLC